jgi:DNA-binding transcriptional ArsR family regulator
MGSEKETKGLERKARIFALFGDPNRLRILDLLVRKKRLNVSELSEGIGMSIACTSHHLQLLRDQEVVGATKEGNSVYYELLADPLVKQLIATLK